MPTLYNPAGGEDGTISYLSTSSWAEARDATAGTDTYRTNTKLINSIQTQRITARGGGERWMVRRAFFMFDTSGISEEPTSADFKVFGFGVKTADFFAVKADYDSEFTTAEFDSIVGWTNSGDQEGNVTKYSAEFDSSEDWNTAAYNTIPLNAAAISDMVSLNDFKICLIESVHDLRDAEPNLPENFWNGCYFEDQSGTSYDPYIDYTVTTAADNATFFGANF